MEKISVFCMFVLLSSNVAALSCLDEPTCGAGILTQRALVADAAVALVEAEERLLSDFDRFHQAAKQGDSRAQYHLAWMYDDGAGVSQNDQLAIKWYLVAAEQGDIDAQYNLALMYDKGEGVAQDFQQAMSWYRKAARQGDTDAQYNLGSIYLSGDGVTKSHVMAYMLWSVAAMSGDEGATIGLNLIAKEMSAQQILEATLLAKQWIADC